MPDETAALRKELTGLHEQYSALERQLFEAQQALSDQQSEAGGLRSQVGELKRQISANAAHADGVSRILAGFKTAADQFQDVLQNAENALDAQRAAVENADRIAPDKPIDASTL